MKKNSLLNIDKLDKILAKSSVVELNRILVAVEKELDKRKAEVSIMNEMRKLAADNGFDFDRLMSEASQDIKTRRELGPAPVRFRHPKNQDLVWSGRGKRPNWMKEAIASGLSEEQLKVA